MITELKLHIGKLADGSPLQQFLASTPTMAWVSLPSTPNEANPIGRTKFPPASEIPGQTLSPIEVPGLNEWLNALAALKIGPLETKCEFVGVLLPTGRILNHLINPTETTTFEKLTFYPEELLAIVNGVLDLMQTSNPALQNLKAAFEDQQRDWVKLRV